jgi:hypothetical protein
MFSKSLYHANQHKVDVHDDVFLQDQEKIKECDKVHCISPVQVNSISPSVSESIINDVSSFSLDNNNCIPQLSQQKVDMVEAGFLQDNLTMSESELISCSKMSPQAGTCAASISLEISTSGLSMSFQPESSAPKGVASIRSLADSHVSAVAVFCLDVLLPLLVLLPRRAFRTILLPW